MGISAKLAVVEMLSCWTVLENIFTMSLKKEGVSIAYYHADAFDAYIALLKRYERKRTTRMLGIMNQLTVGLGFNPTWMSSSGNLTDTTNNVQC